MVTGTRLPGVGSARTGLPARRAVYDRRAFIIGLVRQLILAVAFDPRRPGRPKFELVLLGTIALEPASIGFDPRGDDFLTRLFENRLALLAVGGEERVAAPALEHGRQLPPEIHRVFEPAVQAVAPVRRVAMGGVPGDEDAPRSIRLRDRNSVVPKPDVVELRMQRKAGRPL